MFNKLSAVCLVLGLGVGYAVSGSSVTAQIVQVNPVPSFLNRGDEVILYLDYERSSVVNCTVADIQGIWIRCGPIDRFATQQKQRSFNLHRVIEIEKRERQ